MRNECEAARPEETCEAKYTLESYDWNKLYEQAEEYLKKYSDQATVYRDRRFFDGRPIVEAYIPARKMLKKTLDQAPSISTRSGFKYDGNSYITVEVYFDKDGTLKTEKKNITSNLPENPNENKQMFLFSGTVSMGRCGESAGLYDSNGTPLCIGDLVAVWNTDPTLLGWNDSPEFVVMDEDEEPFIMGLKEAFRKREYLLDGSVSDENDYDTITDTYTSGISGVSWIIHKIKDYKDLAAGETWGGVTVITK